MLERAAWETKPQKTFDFTEVVTGTQSTDDGQWVLCGAGERMGSECSHGHRVLVWDNEKAQEMDGGGGCPWTQMYLMPRKCTLKMVNIVC